jgi:hypothetical protein
VGLGEPGLGGEDSRRRKENKVGRKRVPKKKKKKKERQGVLTEAWAYKERIGEQ